MKNHFLSKALAVVLAFSIGVLPIEASAVQGMGSRIASPLDTTSVKEQPLPECPECDEYSSTPPADLSSTGYCSRQQGGCNSLATGDPNTPRVNVANIRWETYAQLSAAQMEEITRMVRKSYDLPTLNQATAKRAIPESALSNFRSLSVYKKTPSALGSLITANAVTPEMREQPGPPMVTATYQAAEGSLHIEAVRSTRTLGGGAIIQQADITPYHFDLFKVTQAYTTRDEQLAGRMGRNPYDFAKSGNPADDAIFVGMSLEGAKTAVGLAMRQLGATYGVMTISKDTWRSWVTTSGKWYKKKTTYHTAADTESIYYVFTPASTMRQGGDAVICAGSPDASSCDPALRVTSGVSVSQMTGGTFPAVTQMQTYYNERSVTKSFDFVKLIVIAILIVVSVGYLAPLIGPVVGSMFSSLGSMVGITAEVMGTIVEVGSFISGMLPYGGSLVGYASTYIGVSPAFAAGIASAWNYGVGEVVAYNSTPARLGDMSNNEHTLRHNVNLRASARRSIRSVASVYEGLSPDQMTASTMAGMGSAIIPAGAVGQYMQRSRLKADQHAERLIDLEADLEISR